MDSVAWMAGNYMDDPSKAESSLVVGDAGDDAGDVGDVRHNRIHSHAEILEMASSENLDEQQVT